MHMLLANFLPNPDNPVLQTFAVCTRGMKACCSAQSQSAASAAGYE